MVGFRPERVLAGGHFQGRHRRDRIYPAGTQQEEPGAVPPAKFEEVDSAAKIMFQKLTWCRGTYETSKNTGIGSSVDYPVGGG